MHFTVTNWKGFFFDLSNNIFYDKDWSEIDFAEQHSNKYYKSYQGKFKSFDLCSCNFNDKEK